MNFLYDFTLFVIDIHKTMPISLILTPFDHFHLRPTSGLLSSQDLTYCHNDERMQYISFSHCGNIYPFSPVAIFIHFPLWQYLSPIYPFSPVAPLRERCSYCMTVSSHAAAEMEKANKKYDQELSQSHGSE